MSRILLLNPPGKELYLRDQHCSSAAKADYYWPPIDLLSLSGILSQEHEVYVIDAIIDRLSNEECLHKIVSLKPDCIVFVTGIVSWVADFGFMEKAKAQVNSLMIASGGFLRWDYERIMRKYTFLDAIIMDFTISCILDYLKGDYGYLHDMYIRLDGKEVLYPKSEMREFNIPVPRHELFPLAKYRLPHGKRRPFSAVLTGYGCPFSCSYCTAEHIEFKYRPVENILPEIEKLVSLGVREIFFKDFTFGVPRRIAMNLCDEMIERFPGISWICSSRVDVLDEELLKKMKTAGCHTIQFGVESASQKLLDENNKKTNITNIISTFKICNKMGIKTLAHFILGLPGETEESIHDTIKLAKSIKCDYASFNIVTPTYGTSLRKRCIENNWLIGENEAFDSSNGYPVIETPYITREKLWLLRNYAVKSFYLRPGYILRKLAGIKGPGDLFFLVKNGISLLGKTQKNNQCEISRRTAIGR